MKLAIHRLVYQEGSNPLEQEKSQDILTTAFNERYKKMEAYTMLIDRKNLHH